MEKRIISSVSNAKIKMVRQLKRRIIRDELNLFIIEGKKIILQAVKANVIIVEIFIDDKKADEFHEVFDCLPQQTRINYTTDDIIKVISSTKTPQPIVAVAKYIDIDFMIKEVVDDSFALILDDISDPGNLGTIIRTCDAIGVDFIVLGASCVDIHNDKVIRSSMGSIFNIRCLISDNLTKDISDMIEEKWQIACGHLEGDDFYCRKQKRKAALVIGNETRGVRDEIVDICTDKWKLPMRGGAQSLNAAVAAGIMLYDMSKQLK